MKEYFKRLWNAIWGSTDIDEKAEVALNEAKARIAEIKKELITVKGKKRRGKKPYYKNKNKKTNNNSKK